MRVVDFQHAYLHRCVDGDRKDRDLDSEAADASSDPEEECDELAFALQHYQDALEGNMKGIAWNFI